MKRSYSDHCITQSTQANACSSNAVARRARGIRHLSDEELGQHGRENITDNNGDGQSDGSHMAVQRWLSRIAFDGNACDNDNPSDNNYAAGADSFGTMECTTHDIGSFHPDSAYASSQISTTTAEVTEFTFFGQKFESVGGSEPQPVEEKWIKASEAIYQYPIPEHDGRNLPRFCKALDLGTGNSTWAITMARKYPRMKILGIYESSPFRQNDPANLTVMLDNIESGVKDLKKDEYDLVHVRELEGCISDYTAFYQYLFQILKPGGLMIHRELALSSTAKLLEWWPSFEQHRAESLERRGCEVNICARMQRMMKIHFQDVTSQMFDVPAAPFLDSIDCRVAKVAQDLAWDPNVFRIHATMMRKEVTENKQTALYNCYSVSAKKNNPPGN